MDELNLDLDLITIRNFAIALLIGALIGIEREKRRDTEPTIGGLRTFILLAMLGAIGGWLSASYASMIPLLVVLGLASLTVVAGFLIDAAGREGPLGLTTELAAIGVTLLGGFTMLGQPELAVGLGIVAAAVLAYKQPLHGLIDKFGWDDIFAGLRLLIASFIVLPLLPNRALDPWQALNPRQLWLLGRADLRIVAGRLCRDALAGSGPRRRDHRHHRRPGLLDRDDARLLAPEPRAAARCGGEKPGSGTLLSWAVMFVRVVVISFAVVPACCRGWRLPMAAMALATSPSPARCTGATGEKTQGQARRRPAKLVITTPFSLTQAVKFGLLYAAILLVVKIVSDRVERRRRPADRRGHGRLRPMSTPSPCR